MARSSLLLLLGPALLSGCPSPCSGADCEQVFDSALLGLIRGAMSDGRATRADIAKHVFAQLSDGKILRSEGLRGVLSRSIARADEIKDPEAFFAMLDRDRHRANARNSARGLRQQLQAALAAGDRDTANRLTQELVAQMRQSTRKPAGGDA